MYPRWLIGKEVRKLLFGRYDVADGSSNDYNTYMTGYHTQTSDFK